MKSTARMIILLSVLLSIYFMEFSPVLIAYSLQIKDSI